MTHNASADFFANEGSGVEAASYKARGVGDGLMATIKEIRQLDYYPFGEDKPEVKSDGTIRQQLRIIVEGPIDNYATASKPLADGLGNPLPDTGLRAIYAPSGTNISGAIKAAIVAAGARGLDEGGQLGVKLVEERPSGKGNPLKVWEAKYIPPAAGAGFDFGAGQQQGAPAAQPPAQQWQQPAPQAAPQQQWQQPAPPQAQPQQQWAQPQAPVAQPPAAAPQGQAPWGQQPQAPAPAAAQPQWGQQPVTPVAPVAPPQQGGDPWATQGQPQAPQAPVQYTDEPPF